MTLLTNASQELGHTVISHNRMSENTNNIPGFFYLPKKLTARKLNSDIACNVTMFRVLYLRITAYDELTI
jgi:hypothetical protein